MAHTNKPVVLIVSYGRPDLLDDCLRSLREHAEDWPVRVWDNRSPQSPDVAALAELHPHVGWHFSEENIGFAAAVNRLAERTDGDFLLLNPDAVLVASLEPLRAELAADPTLAAIGPQIRVDGLQPWDNARRLPGPFRMLGEHLGFGSQLRGLPLGQRYRRPPRYAGYVSGACLLVRRESWVRVGSMDETFWLYSEEVDWATRARGRGLRVGLYPGVLAHHVGGATLDSSAAQRERRRALLVRSQVAYLRKHHGAIAATTFLRTARAWNSLRALRRRRRLERAS